MKNIEVDKGVHRLKPIHGIGLLVIGQLLSSLSFASFDCEFNITNQWASGGTAEILVTNTEDHSETVNEITLALNAGVEVSQSWSMRIGESIPYNLVPFSWNNEIGAGQTVKYGMLLSGNLVDAKAQLGGDCGGVQNQPPVVTMDSCASARAAIIYAGMPLSIAAGGPAYCWFSADDPDGDLLNYSLDWGDGKIAAWKDQGNDFTMNHEYTDYGNYNVTVTVSDGESTATASKQVEGGVSELPMPLIHCVVDSLSQEVACKDRGSFDSDSDDLLFAAFDDEYMDDSLLLSSDAPLDFNVSGNGADELVARYGVVDELSISEQLVYARLTGMQLPETSRQLECSWQLGETHSYGTDATLSITNTAGIRLTNWITEMQFQEATQVVNHSGAKLTIVDGPEYYLERSERGYFDPGETETVTMVLQGEAVEPMLSGDCSAVYNHPPVATFEECPAGLVGAFLYADTFLTTTGYTGCRVSAFDADGDDLSFWFDWGDGTVTDAKPLDGETGIAHPYIEAGDYEVSLTVSDGENTDQISKTISAGGASLPPQPLVHCEVDRDNLSVACEDRGSFDPDGAEGLGFAAFAENEVLQTDVTPFAFSKQFTQEGSYGIRYGITDGHNVSEQRISVALEDFPPSSYDSSEPLDCYYRVGETHEYGTEAILEIERHSTYEPVDPWFIKLIPEDGTKIVYVNNADLWIAQKTENYEFNSYYLTGRSLSYGESIQVKLIVQGNAAEDVPGIFGNCDDRTDEIPTIQNCRESNDTYLYANVFEVEKNEVTCDINPPYIAGDYYPYSVNWGDGGSGRLPTHNYSQSGTYTATVYADGQASTEINVKGSAPGKTLVHCELDRNALSISCEDRGSFDPDSTLRYAAFVNGDVYDTSEAPMTFSKTFAQEGSYLITYGTVDEANRDEQRIYAQFKDLTYSNEGRYDCEFSYGEMHDYGTEATLTVLNGLSTKAELRFPGAAQVVNIDQGELYLTGESTVINFSHIDGNQIHMIVQGETSQPPVLAGDCKATEPQNRAPTACFTHTELGGGLGMYTFDAACSSDPDGDPLTYSWSFSNGGEATGVTAEGSFEPGQHQAILTVSDGEASDIQVVDFIVSSYPEPDIQCSYNLDSQWSTGFTGTVTLKNMTDQSYSNWEASWRFIDESAIQTVWGAQLTEESASRYTAKALSWNNSIPAGGTVSFGMQGTGKGNDLYFLGECAPLAY